MIINVINPALHACLHHLPNFTIEVREEQVSETEKSRKGE